MRRNSVTHIKGKQIVITGASSGIGKAIALSAAKEHASLLLVARDQQKLEQVAKQCKQWTPYPVLIQVVDLADRLQRSQWLQTIEQLPQIDVWVNSAGYGLYQYAVDFQQQEVEEMFEVNVFALIECSNRIARKMMQQEDGGHIIQLASQAGKIATGKSSIYSSTKSAVIGYSNALRLELLPYKVHVTTVNPGPVATAFFDRADATGTYLKAIGGVALSPETLADRIVSVMGTAKREINAPLWMEIGSRLAGMFPSIADRLLRNVLNKK